MSESTETPKSAGRRTQIVPLVANHYPVPNNPKNCGTGRRDSSTIKFIARSMSMVPVPVPSQDDGEEDVHITDHELNQDLEPIADLDMVLIRQIPQNIEEFINVPNKYQVENSSGDKLYDIVETTDALTRRLFGSLQPFTMKLISKTGDYICEWDGDPGVTGRGAFVKVMRKSSLLGKIVQTKPSPLSCCIFSPVYSVLNMKEKTVSMIRLDGKTGFKLCKRRTPVKFAVQSNKTTTKPSDLVASISQLHQDEEATYCWADSSQGQEDAYSLNFHDAQMDRDEKMLLFAAVILLDFQFFNGKERSPWCKVVTVFVVVLLVVLVVVGIVYLVARQISKD